MKWFEIVLKFLPTILGIIKPELLPLGGGIAAAVVEAEQLWGPGTGPQKLDHVVNLAGDLAGVANLSHDASGKTTLVDPVALKTTVADGLRTGIEVVNLLTKRANSPS